MGLRAEGPPDAAAALAASLVDRMTDEQVVGQILMLAYSGDAPGAVLYDWIEKRSLGGVKIFGWNAEDSDKVAMAVDGIQTAALGSGLGLPLSSPPIRKAGGSATSRERRRSLPETWR